MVCLFCNQAMAGHSKYFFQVNPAKEYKGKITDNYQRPLANATITVSGNTVAAKTNRRGEFAISGHAGDTLYVKLPQYQEQQMVLGEEASVSLVLIADATALVEKEEVVRLPYNDVPESLNIASTDVVYNKDIVKAPVASLRNALTGRLAGLVTWQFTGQPGADGVQAALRNQQPLIIIDGIPRNLTVFDLEEVESVTAVKDALGMAMLGVRGSNGALHITTRKGSISKQQISFTAQTAFQKPVDIMKPLRSYDYARLYNEALANDGLPVAYSNADLQGYQNDSDPYTYPDVDWQKEILKGSSRFDRYTLSATGGNRFARYFVSLEHLNQTGLFKQSDINTYSTNNNFQSYIIRSNVDVSISPKLTGGIYVLGRILHANEPGNGATQVYFSMVNTPNNAYPVRNPNGSFGGTQQFQNNILAQSINSGYRQNYKRDMLADVYLKRSLDELTPGLYIRVAGSYFATLSENIFRNKTFAVFRRTASPSGDVYQQFGTDGTQANGNGIDYQGRMDYFEARVGYNRQFDVHGLDATVLVNRDNAVSGSDLPYTISGGSGRFAYNYSGKYIAEFAFGYNGSNRYPPSGSTKRGFFPAVGVAWNMHEEKFMEGFTGVDRLKLFGSVGKTGWDNPGYFTYIQRYFDGVATYFGTGAGSNTSIAEQPLANPDISFEKANKLNIGIQTSLLKNRLSFTAEYFNMKFYDLLMQRGRNTAIIGNEYPNENIGINRTTGMDFQLSWTQESKSFAWYVSANAGIVKSKVLYMDEVDQPYEWMKRTGQRVGALFGYVADGLFQSQSEIDGHATIDGYTPQPGDIKYKDINEDGVINQFDQVSLFGDVPTVSYGLVLGAAWKGFDFSALIQGLVNVQLYTSSFFEFQNSGFGQAFEHHLDRWTPSTAATATYPRLSIGNNINNHATSSYWVRKYSFARVKNLELGYTLPAKWTDRAKLQSVRIFASASNYFTLTDLETIDPEGAYGLYPVQKLLNLGINIKL